MGDLNPTQTHDPIARKKPRTCHCQQQQFCHEIQRTFFTFPCGTCLGTRVPDGNKPAPSRSFCFAFPSVFVNSACVCAYSEWFLSYIYASTRKWTRFKSKYSSYTYLLLGKGDVQRKGKTAFLTTGPGDSVCQQLPLQLLHTHFSIRSQKNKNIHTCLGFSLLLTSSKYHTLIIPNIHNNIQ